MGRHPQGPRDHAPSATPLGNALRARLDGILDLIAELDDTLGAEAERCDELRNEREQLFQDRWRLNKELAALKRAGEDYDALAASQAETAARQAEVREGLQRLLADVKALNGELRRG